MPLSFAIAFSVAILAQVRVRRVPFSFAAMASKKAMAKLKGMEMKMAMIADEDMLAGFILAGIGQRDGQGNTNFLAVNASTRRAEIEAAFKQMTARNDVGVVIIGQHIADMIRHAVNEYQAEGKVIPTILEVPNKDHPYNPNTDSVMQRVKVFMGGNIAGFD